MKNVTCDRLIEKVLSYNKDADVSLIKKAFEFAKKIHEGHMRLSGDPYISHPLAVSEILAGLEQDEVTIAAALLHDVIEDGDVSRGDLAASFSEDVARLVEGVTKLGRLTFESREERQAENFRKMFLAMGEDIRIIIIKLADRLHNMQTLKFLSREKQKETSLETKEIFAPLAHRLGMWRLKWELEDLAFRFLEAKKFEEVKEKIAETRLERESYLSDFNKKVNDVLGKVDIKAEIYGRPKHFYSIYKKMVEQNLEFEELYDLMAIRIIVDTIKGCYAALGVIHAAWKPIPGRFRDYIAMPKSNGYQSLHTTVIGPGGRPVEIQIRTREMHRVAEYGVAAHWRYKEGATDKEFDAKMSWLRQMLDWQTELKDAKDFMESLKIDLFVDEVFVFTPKGAVFDLPVGSTPVDFAYRVHTEVGHRCIGAKTNGRIVPLDQKLKNGDIVEITVGKVNNPSLDWLNFVKTTGAKTKIKSWFKKQKRIENFERGRRELQTELKKLLLDPKEVLLDENLDPVLKEYSLDDKEDFFVALGNGEISAYQAAKRLRLRWERRHGAPPIEEEEVKPLLTPTVRARKKAQAVKVTDIENVLVRLSMCCRPLPGDEIIGFVTKGRGVAVHRRDCPNVINLKPSSSRLVQVAWDEKIKDIYPVEIEVEAFDRVGVLKDILSEIAEIGTNVSGADVQTKRGSTAYIKLTVDVKDVEHLTKVIKAIRKTSDVYDVYRTDIYRSRGLKQK